MTPSPMLEWAQARTGGLGVIKLFLDIETLPGDESLRREIETEIKPPGNISRPERIKQWEEEEKPGAMEERYRKTALEGLYGRILCIGYVKESPLGITEKVITGEEPAILQEFWDTAKGVDLFVGFKILDFDLKFIMQRSIIQGVKPTRELNFARYRSEPIYDVMREWQMWDTGYVALDVVTRALGIESPKGELDGSKVYDYYREGRLEDIYAYCMRDVKATREIYKRMNFLA